jgi:hypothetical protein
MSFKKDFSGGSPCKGFSWQAAKNSVKQPLGFGQNRPVIGPHEEGEGRTSAAGACAARGAPFCDAGRDRIRRCHRIAPPRALL